MNAGMINAGMKLEQGMGRRMGAVLMAVAVLLPAVFAASAKANHITAWSAAGGSIPAGVDLNDVVVASGGIVVAVGHEDIADGAGGQTTQAVIYRRVGANWHRDTLPAAAGSGSELLDVAVTDTAGAWAVGRASASAPLAVRLTNPALSADAAASWAQPGAADSALGVARAVGLRGTRGLIGDASGRVFPVDATGSGTVGAPIAPVQPAGAVNSVSLYSDTAGYAVTDMPPASENRSDRIYRVEVNAAPVPSTMQPIPDGSGDTKKADLVSVAGISQSDGFAIEKHPPDSPTDVPGYWQPGTGLLGAWNRFTSNAMTSGSNLRDLSLVVSGSSRIEAIAGDESGAGSIWRRGGGVAGWARQAQRAVVDSNGDVSYVPLSSEAMNGVAVVGADNIWAVGEGAMVAHYAPLPDPPPPVRPAATINSGPTGTTPDRTPTFSFSADQSDAWFDCRVDSAAFQPCESPKSVSPLLEGSHKFQVRAENSAGVGTVVTRSFRVDVPGCPIPSPLADRVSVKKYSKSVRVSFRLRDAARVKVVLTARGVTVGKTSWTTMNKGNRRLYVTFKRAPTRLHFMAKPVRNCDV